jgi:predicted DsbA family dithiol-disulfide isomerase/uncharacterized membrane protein
LRVKQRVVEVVMAPRAALLVACIGFFIAATMGIAHHLGLMVPCGSEGGCAQVAADPASMLMGIPIAWFGALAYLLAAGLVLGCRSCQARILLVVLASLGTVISAVLLWYAQQRIGATCWWCVASGVTMVALLLMSFLILRAGDRARPAGFGVVFVCAAATAIAIGVQSGRMVRDANRPLLDPLAAAGLGVDQLIDPAKSLGQPGAPVTVVVFADLLCPACIMTHKVLLSAHESYPDGLRVAFRHAPLTERSAAVAALSEIAAEHGRFWEFAEAIAGARPDREGMLNAVASVGLDPAEAEARIARSSDPAVGRLHEEMEQADRLGIRSTPAILLLINGEPPRTIPAYRLRGLLESPEMQARLRLLPE